MVNAYYDEDADLSAVKDETIAIIGYGNQGRAQGLNMRDSGLNVVVGNIKDASWDMAAKDGFEVYSIGDAAELAGVILLLVPDEVQPEVFEEEVKNKLRPGKSLVFAHGYNIHYGFITPPKYVDVLLLAPRMMGVYVRELFVKGSGAPAFIFAHQNASGKAKEKTLALAKAIGATRAGAMEISFAEETELDHFTEHFIMPVIIRALQLSFEVLVEEKYTPEAVVLEHYASGELSEIFKEMAKVGIFKQMPLHSTTSQYGTLSYGKRVMPDETKKLIKEIIREIKTGVFAREWMMEQKTGYPVFKKLRQMVFTHPINEVERRLKEMVKISI